MAGVTIREGGAIPHKQAAALLIALGRADEVAPLVRELGLGSPLELSLRFAQAHPGVSRVIVGYSDLDQREDAIRWTARDPLPAPAVARIVAPMTQAHGAGATVEAVRRRPQGGVFASPLSEARAMSGARGGTGAGPQGGGGH